MCQGSIFLAVWLRARAFTRSMRKMGRRVRLSPRVRGQRARAECQPRKTELEIHTPPPPCAVTCKTPQKSVGEVDAPAQILPGFPLEMIQEEKYIDKSESSKERNRSKHRGNAQCCWVSDTFPLYLTESTHTSAGIVCKAQRIPMQTQPWPPSNQRS